MSGTCYLYVTVLSTDLCYKFASYSYFMCCIDTLDGADSGTTTLFAGVITSLLCGLLSVFL